MPVTYRRTQFSSQDVIHKYRPLLGLCLADDKLTVLRSGNINFDAIDPVLIHAAYLWGYFLQEDDNYFRPIAESSELHSTIECLNDDTRFMEPTVALQVGI